MVVWTGFCAGVPSAREGRAGGAGAGGMNHYRSSRKNPHPRLKPRAPPSPPPSSSMNAHDDGGGDAFAESVATTPCKGFVGRPSPAGAPMQQTLSSPTHTCALYACAPTPAPPLLPSPTRPVGGLPLQLHTSGTLPRGLVLLALDDVHELGEDREAPVGPILLLGRNLLLQTAGLGLLGHL